MDEACDGVRARACSCFTMRLVTNLYIYTAGVCYYSAHAHLRGWSIPGMGQTILLQGHSVDEKHNCLAGKTIWSVHVGKKKVSRL